MRFALVADRDMYHPTISAPDLPAAMDAALARARENETGIWVIHFNVGPGVDAEHVGYVTKDGERFEGPEAVEVYRARVRAERNAKDRARRARRKEVR